MAIRFRNVLCAAALVGGSVFITAQVVSQDQEKQMEEMWQQWMEMSQPGPEHEHMLKSAGTWHQETKHWVNPDSAPDVSTATATMTPIMDGRFMLEKVRGTGEVNGEPYEFEGMGIFGFDKAKKKHVLAWVDNMSTRIMTGEGTADPTGKIITYFTTMPDPMSGGMMELKSVATAHDNDHQTVEVFTKDPDGSWIRSMEQVLTRKK
ncbi:MAG: DUF1579 domain-containing protein [Planctomycetota bacterium]|jgi:hypothetical protein